MPMRVGTQRRKGRAAKLIAMSKRRVRRNHNKKGGRLRFRNKRLKNKYG